MSASTNGCALLIAAFSRVSPCRSASASSSHAPTRMAPTRPDPHCDADSDAAIFPLDTPARRILRDSGYNAERSTTSPVEALTEPEAAAELAQLAPEIAHHDRCTTAGRAGDHRRRLRRAAPAQRRDRGALPAPDPPGFAIQARRRAPESGFAKLRHRVPMLSLDNALDAEEFAEFCARARRFLGLPAERRWSSWPSRRSTGCRST